MRKICLGVFAAIFLASSTLWYLPGPWTLGQEKKPFAKTPTAEIASYVSRDWASGEEKKPAEKVSAAEMGKLIEQLASNVFAERQKAHHRLRTLPGTIRPLREALKSPLDLETRRRVEGLLDEATRDRFRRLLREEAGRKGDARIDLLTDLLLANRRHVSEEDWKLTVASVSAIADKVCRGAFFDVPWVDWIPKCREAIGGRVDTSYTRGGRIIADRVVLEQKPTREPFCASTIAVVSECMEDFTAHVCLDSILLIGADRPDGKRLGGYAQLLSRSFIYCDGDFELRDHQGCGVVILASGRVTRTGPPEPDLIIIGALRRASAVKLFSLSDVGLKLASNETLLEVEAVDPNSAAGRCGLQKGDLIQGYAKRADLERAARKAFARGVVFPLRVQREAHVEKVTFSFAD